MHGRHRRARGRVRTRRLAVVVVGLLFLFAPAGAYVSGVRATEIENRRLTAFPSPAEGWEFFPEVSAWATDHLPLRDRAVTANTRLSEAVFGEPPQYGTPTGPGAAGPVAPPAEAPTDERAFPRVLEGRDGWLFYGLDVSYACEPARPVEQTLAQLSRLGELLRSAGKTYVFTIAPDKSTVRPEKLPERYVGDDCAPEGKQRLWEQVRARPPVGYVDLHDEFLRVQATGAELWRPTDTHWSPRGALVYAQAVATALDPRLMDGTEPVQSRSVQAPGDLSNMLGATRYDTVESWGFAREGVRVTENTATALRSTSTGAPLYAPDTVIVGDSFTQNSRTALAPLFASARIVHPQAAVDHRAEAVEAVAGAETVVLELVERDVARGRPPVLDEAFLSALESALAPAPTG